MRIRNRTQNTRLIVGMALLLAAQAGLAVAAEEYKLDASHSSIEFAVKHMVISNVKGTFPDFSGAIVYNEKDITKSSVELIIKVASINTNNSGRDEHLRAPDFFDAEEYPDITFGSTKIEKAGEGLLVTGNLTIRGIAKEVSFPVDLTDTIKDPYGNVRFGVEGKLQINRQDYGISWSGVMDNGGLVVSDKVKIEINLEAVRKQ